MNIFSEIIIASRNINKIAHIENSLSELGIQTKSMLDFDMEDPEENGTDYKENALIKAENMFSRYNIPVLADDSGFEIECLNGFPGTVSARFASACGSYDEAFRILNSCISINKKASFTTVMALVYYDKGQKVQKLFEGKITGTFIYPGRGVNGFGYCPCFVPDGYNQTLSEMSDEKRMEFNHRAIALEKLCDFLKMKF